MSTLARAGRMALTVWPGGLLLCVLALRFRPGWNGRKTPSRAQEDARLYGNRFFVRFVLGGAAAVWAMETLLIPALYLGGAGVFLSGVTLSVSAALSAAALFGPVPCSDPMGWAARVFSVGALAVGVALVRVWVVCTVLT